jgi:hypothetical protein
MDALRGLAVGFLTSKKFIGMVVGQLMLALFYVMTHLPPGLEGLALEAAQMERVEAYATKAVGILITWLAAQGAADFGKNKPSA